MHSHRQAMVTDLISNSNKIFHYNNNNKTVAGHYVLLQKSILIIIVFYPNFRGEKPHLLTRYMHFL